MKMVEMTWVKVHPLNMIGEFPCNEDGIDETAEIFTFAYISKHCEGCDYFGLCQFRAFILQFKKAKRCGM